MRPTGNRFLALLHEARANPVVVAHRGDSYHAPENTLEAARLAHRAGACAWELDVQLTRDGVPVVLHDESLLRTSDAATRFEGDVRGLAGFQVADFDLGEVQALDAGSWFVAEGGGLRSARSFGTLGSLEAASIERYRRGRLTIPTLVEALVLTRELDWLVNVEIKSFPTSPAGLVERVLAIVADTGTGSRVLRSGFDHADVAAANRPGREYALGILTSTPLYRTDVHAAEIVGADTVHVATEVLGSASVAYRRQPGVKSLRSELVIELEKRKLPLLAYTVNAHGPDSLAEHLAEAGLAGLFTDDPRGMRQSFDSRPGQAH